MRGRPGRGDAGRPHRAAGGAGRALRAARPPRGRRASWATPTCRRAWPTAALADDAVGRGARSAPSARRRSRCWSGPSSSGAAAGRRRHRRASVEYFGHDAVYLVRLADGAALRVRVHRRPGSGRRRRASTLALRRRRPRSPSPPCPRRRADRADLIGPGRGPGRAWAPPSAPRRAGHRWSCSSGRPAAGGAGGQLRGRRRAGRPRQPPPAPGHRAAHPRRPARACSATTCSGARATAASGSAGRWIAFPLRPARPGCGACRRAFARRRRRATPPSARCAGPRADTFAEVLRAGLGPTICDALLLPVRAQDLGRRPGELAGEQARRRVSARLARPHLRAWLRGAGRAARHLPLPPARLRPDLASALADAAVDAGADLRLGAEVDARRPRPGRRAVAPRRTATSSRRGASGRPSRCPRWPRWPARRRRPRCSTPPARSRFRAMVLVYLVLDRRPLHALRRPLPARAATPRSPGCPSRATTATATTRPAAPCCAPSSRATPATRLWEATPTSWPAWPRGARAAAACRRPRRSRRGAVARLPHVYPVYRAGLRAGPRRARRAGPAAQPALLTLRPPGPVRATTTPTTRSPWPGPPPTPAARRRLRPRRLGRRPRALRRATSSRTDDQSAGGVAAAEALGGADRPTAATTCRR